MAEDGKRKIEKLAGEFRQGLGRITGLGSARGSEINQSRFLS